MYMGNPNSTNQTWSRWIWVIWPGNKIERPYLNVRDNIARFVRKGFGSGTRINLVQKTNCYELAIDTEGHPVHDPEFVERMRQDFHRFFVNGFGVDTQTRLRIGMLAGSRQDGSPPVQWVEMPSLKQMLVKEGLVPSHG